jgi:oligogalacturonide transport system substrate-binding protein
VNFSDNVFSYFVLPAGKAGKEYGMIARKTLLLVAVVWIAGIVCVYAGGGAAQGGGGPQAATNTASFMWWGDEPRNKATQKAVEEFLKANPGKTINTLPNPFDGYHDKIIIQLANGTAPDLVCFSSEWMSEVGFAKNPVLKDLREMKDIIDLSTFDQTLLAGGDINGHLIGLPSGVSGWTMAYNKNVFSEFAKKSGKGLPPGPGETWTVEQFIDYAKAFKQTMGPDYAMFSTATTEMTYIFLFFLSELAGKYYVTPKAELTVTEQNILDTLKLFKRFEEAGVLPAGHLQVESLGDATVTQVNVASGKWAGWFGKTSNYPQYEFQSKSEVATMAYPVTGRPEFDGLYVQPSMFWVIPNASKNQVLASQLLNFLMNEPAGITALEIQRSVPPTEKAQKVLADAGLLKGVTFTSTQYLSQNAKASYSPFVLIPQILDTLRSEYSRFITGNATAEATAKTIYNRWQQILTEVRKTNGL